MRGRTRVFAALVAVAVVALVGLGVGGGAFSPSVVEPAAVAAASPTAPGRRPSGGLVAATPSPFGPSAVPSASPEQPTTSPSPIPSNPPTATAELTARLDAALDRLREKHAMPGVSATIIFADGSRWTGASGLADVGRSSPVTTRTIFALASISKTFVAAAVLSLVDDGHLRLDDRVARLLPDLGLSPRITVRHLLDHTSGLHDFFFDPAIDKALLGRPAAVWTAGRSLTFVGKPYFKPGRGWHYSNTNYLVLGLLVERVTGRSLAEEIRQRFIGPLGLRSTYTQAEEEPLGPVAHAYRFADADKSARPIDLTDGTSVMPFRSVVTAAGGAGGMAGTPTDVARWARALYGGELLSAESLAQVVTVDGRPAVGHSGRFIGVRGVMRWLPDEQIAIAILTNQSRRDPAVIARALLRVILGKPAWCTPTGPCPGTPPPASPAPDESASPSPQP
jgi:D-alanyl-D-alanine carboxypeptidase